MTEEDKKTEEVICDEREPKGFIKVLHILGIEISRDEKLHLSFKRRFLYILVTLGVVFIIFSGGMTWYSNQPAFCDSCHIMDPYYNAWETSSHNFVSCVDCHYPPGKPSEVVWHKFQALSQVVKYVTRTYSSKPFAEIDDKSCLRSGCHQTRLLEGKEISESGVQFDHAPHLQDVRLGKQLRCVSCHSQIVIGNHMEVTWDTCYLCHLKGREGERKLEPLGGCEGCHLLPDKEIEVGNVTVNHQELRNHSGFKCQDCHRESAQGQGAVREERCFTCHNEPDKLERFDEVDFLHSNHVTRHNTACFHCHQKITHGQTIKREAAGLVSDCHKCHSLGHDVNAEFYAGRGAEGIGEMPSPMFLSGVDCVGCHVKKMNGSTGLSHAFTYTGTEVACNSCHGEEYSAMVAESQALIEETLRIISGNYDILDKRIEEKPLPENMAKKVMPVVEQAKHNLDLVGHVQSVHNTYYAAEALFFADKVTGAAAKLAGAEINDTSALPVVTGHYCSTLCHPKVGVDTPPETIEYKGKTISHQVHLDEGMSCRVCHDFGEHKDVKFKGHDVCLRCHSEEKFE